jgi:hypothetical protein
MKALKVTAAILFVVLLMLGGYFLYLYMTPTVVTPFATPLPQTGANAVAENTYEGTISCLTLPEGSTYQLSEPEDGCTFGLVASDGNTYALSFVGVNIADLQAGERVRLKGSIKPGANTPYNADAKLTVSGLERI